jgi:acetoin utilization deacetylase AcuC-like enzyme
LRTAYISHRQCHGHDTGWDHPENARRLSAIEDRFVSTGLFDVLRYVDAPKATNAQLLRVHRPEYLEALDAMMPREGYARLDPDTVVSPGSLEAARHAAGAVVAAVDRVVGGAMQTAFCNVRPPGHHAESNRAMGFCLFNNIAVGAAHALAMHGLERVAIVDFDVHHGNGTEEIFQDEPRVLFCSTFQHPFFPYTPLRDDAPNRVSVPLDSGAGGEAFREAVDHRWLPVLRRHRPQLVFVSAGFDAHRDDEMAHMNLTDADFHWVSEQIARVAADFAGGRVISVLEGGYDCDSLARCVEDHVRVLAGLG